MSDEKTLNKATKLIKLSNYIYVIGNGGAASSADHLACDLMKNAGLKAISLCSNNALISAIGNDISFDDIYLEQLKVLFNKNDILIALSTSGNSENVVKAAKYIYDFGGKVLSITCGGELINYSTLKIIVEKTDIQEAEDEINIICHKIYKKILDS